MTGVFRKTLRLMAPIVVAAIVGLAATGARAEVGAVSMDTDRQTALARMRHLAGPELGSLEGRVVVVAFFASWCPPCRPEFGHLNGLRKIYGADDLAILAINVFEDFIEDAGNAARMRRFLGTTKPAFTVLAGEDDGRVTATFGGVDRIPTVLVFDRAGKPAYQFIHAEGATKTHATLDELKAAVAPLF